MIITILGAAVLAIAVAGAILLGFRLAGRKPPPGTLPLAAGVALIAFFVWNDYTWYRRTSAQLPDHIQVARTYPSSHMLQPWTYLVPHIARFSAVDTGSLKRNDSAPGYVLARIFLAERYVPTIEAWQIYDCNGGRSADVGKDTEFGDDGLPAGATWHDLTEDDAFRPLICGDAGG